MKYLLTAFAIFLMAFAPSSSVTFSDVRGTSQSDGIVVQWSTSQEDGVSSFSVVRVSPIDQSYSQVASVAATGGGSVYQVVDKAIYKTSSASVFVYRILAMSGSTQVGSSNYITVTYEFSGLSGVAKRTWGSIKAMFR